MAAPDQEVDNDEARVGGHVLAGENREQGVGSTQAMLHGFAVLIRRHELGGQPQIVDVDGLALQTIGLVAADIDGPCRSSAACKLGGNAGFLPRFLEQCCLSIGSGGDAAADEVIQETRIDRLRRTASGEPHLPAIVIADDSVGVRGKGMNAEVARRGALELEQRRAVRVCGNGVGFVAPGRKRALPGEGASDYGERGRARFGCGQPTRQFDPAFAPLEHVPPLRESPRALGPDPADNTALGDERCVLAGRRGEHAPEPLRYAGNRIHRRDPLLRTKQGLPRRADDLRISRLGPMWPRRRRRSRRRCTGRPASPDPSAGTGWWPWSRP